MRKLHAILLLIVLALIFAVPASAQGEGTVQPDLQIWGFGLVVGLQGTGDAKITERTRQAVTRALEEGGHAVPDNLDFYQPGNIAYVAIIANVPSDYLAGDQMDALISALGDATDLRGGLLLPAPLRALDDQVYALAQGRITDDMVGLEGFDGPFTRARLTAGATINRPIMTSGLNDASTVFVAREVSNN